MGLFDWGGKVLVSYKADISDMKAGLKELSAEEKKLAEQQIASAEAHNKSLEQQKSGLGDLALAAAAAYAVYAVGKNALLETLEFNKQAAASVRFDIEALKEAAGGLKDDMELMTFAARTSHGALKLNQEQMDLFQKAIRGYTKDGFDAKEVTDAWTDALISGKTRGLKAFGIEIDETHSKSLKLNELIKAASGEVAKYGGNLDVAGDDMRKLGVSWTDALDDLKHKIGELVIELKPLLDLLAKAVGLIADLVPTSLSDTDAGKALADYKDQDENGWRWNTWGEYQQKWLGDADAARGGAQFESGVYAELGQAAALIGRASMSIRGKEHQHARGHAADHSLDAYYTQMNNAGPAYSFAADLGANPNASGLGGFTGGAASFGDSDLAAGMQRNALADQARAAETASRGDRYGSFMRGKQSTWLEGVFGKLEEFDAYKSALKGLTDSMTAAYSAWASGSASAGEALKKTLGTSIAGVGASMFVHGLEKTAMGIGDLFWAPEAAAQDFASAGAFFAGAAIAGEVARQFGGPSVPSGGGGGAGGSRGAGGGSLGAPLANGPTGGAAGPAHNVTVIIGDEFAPASPLQLANRAFDGIQRAKKLGGDGQGVIWG